MRFEIDHLALGILLLLLLAAGLIRYFFFPSHKEPTLSFSHLQTSSPRSLKLRLAFLPSLLLKLGLISFMIAFLDPHFVLPYEPSVMEKKQEEIPTKGIALYLLLDQSGSMLEEIHTPSGRMPKVDLLKQVTVSFIKDHPSDLIGLIAFARIPQIILPLTLDQNELLTKLSQFDVVNDANDDGTAMGYAIYKAANLIAATRQFAKDLPADAKPAYEIKNSIILVVTDGLQDPNRLDYGSRLRTIELDDAAKYAKGQGIKVYIVNVDPSISRAEFAPQRKQMQTITELTGGKLFLVDEDQDLAEVYHSIDKIEKENIPALITPIDQKSMEQRINLFPYLILLGLLFIFLSIFLDSLVIKKVP
jgi:Ca-activated chloride channel homolog